MFSSRIRFQLGVLLFMVLCAVGYAAVLVLSMRAHRHYFTPPSPSRIKVTEAAPLEQKLPKPLFLAPGDVDAGRFEVSKKHDPIRDFESEYDIAGYKISQGDGEPTAVERTDEQHSGDGRFALKIPVSFPRTTTLSKRTSRGLGKYRLITYDVYVPADAPIDAYIYSLFAVADKDGLWYQAQSRRLRPGAWSTVQVDLRARSTSLEPVGHYRAWDAQLCDEIAEITFQFYADRPYQGTLFFDSLRAWSLPPAEQEIPGTRRAAPGEAGGGRALAIKALAVSAALVRQYETFEVTFELNREFSDPFDPAQIRVDASFFPPQGDRLAVPGFLYQDYRRSKRGVFEKLTPVGRPLWKVRFTPRQTGEYRYQIEVHAAGEATALRTAKRAFTVDKSDHPGFVQIAEDGHHFEFENGGMYFPIGHNFRSPTDTRCSQMVGITPTLDRRTYVYDEFMPRMAAGGENFFEMWMASWWVGLEWNAAWKGYKGAGRYNLANAWRMDHVLAAARKHGLRVHLVIDNHGKLSTRNDHEWENSPYNRRNHPVGGWGRVDRAVDWQGLDSPDEFFKESNEAGQVARKIYQRRLRYLFARWGHDPTIMGIEIISEVDLTCTDRRLPRSPAMRAWHAKTIDYIKDNLDIYNRPITTHYSGNYKTVDPAMARLPQIDYVVGDAYRSGQKNFVRMAEETARVWGRFDKPFMITEFGGNWNAASEQQLEADLHTGLWSSWMTGASGTPLLWWFDLIDLRDWYPHFRAFANFVKDEDRRGKRRTRFRPRVQHDSGRNLRAIGIRGRKYADLWVYDEQAMASMPPADERPRFHGVRVRVPDLTTGRWRVEYWDTYGGSLMKSEILKLSDDELTITLPPFTNDIAVKIRATKRLPFTPRESSDPRSRRRAADAQRHRHKPL